MDTEIELLFDISGPAGPGDQHQIRRFFGQPGVFMCPVRQRALDERDLEQSNVDLRDQARHAGPPLTVGQDERPALGQGRLGSGDSHVEVVRR